MKEKNSIEDKKLDIFNKMASVLILNGSISKTCSVKKVNFDQNPIQA